ncbi:PREDICTED: odorant receptor 49b-like [Dinoponera quadriceps]|uniref:Odorant receptor n=1 Tax=Dinoponera quadriceps TaxID=609295 RepID=A0A6P3WZ10_DINQU|nr:PREDICTED: odorant receptor 49b-like [Dinoponera quadriceps]
MTDFKWAISLHRFMLKSIGLWPPDSRNVHEIVRSKFRLLCNVITLLFITTIPTLVSLLRIWGDMTLKVENLECSLPMLMALFKISIIWYNQKVSITLVLPCFGLMVRHVTNLTDCGRPLLIQSYYLHDVSKSPQFELTYLAQGIVLFTGCLSYSAVDHFLGLLIFHVCGQLENLHLRLRHMEKYPNFNAVLKYNVQDHIRLIRSVEIIDNTFDLMLLGLMICFCIEFCLQGFLIVNIVKKEGQLPFMQLGWIVAMILYILLHMGLYCGVGEVLVTQSEKIHRAAYEYSWHTIEPKAAKNLLLIMLRSNKPLYITAGKTFPMTMATLCNLLKTSAGYVSVLLANQN